MVIKKFPKIKPPYWLSCEWQMANSFEDWLRPSQLWCSAFRRQPCFVWHFVITWYLPVLRHPVWLGCIYRTFLMFYEHVFISLPDICVPSRFYCLSESKKKKTSQPLNTAVTTYHSAHSYEATFQIPSFAEHNKRPESTLVVFRGSAMKHLTWDVKTKVCYLVKPSHRHQSLFFLP